MSGRSRLLAGCGAASLCIAGFSLPVAAQTSIAADTAALSLGTVAAKNGNIVSITGGTSAGPNLFHSFSAFTLAAGDVARWEASGAQAANTLNIVNRVTGGAASSISGTIDSSAFPNANFYFLNPAGVIFGAGARLNVPNAFNVSTASELGFASGPKFTMATPSGATFSIDAPQSFGFLGAPGTIRIAGADTSFAGTSKQLAVSAGNIQIGASGSTTNLNLSRADFVAIGSGTTLAIDDPLSAAANGNLSFVSAGIFPSGSNGRASLIRTNAGATTLDSSIIRSFGGGADRAADLMFNTGSMRLGPGAQIGTATVDVSGGGSITIRATGGVTLQSGSQIFARATGAGDAGRFQLTGDSLTMEENTGIDTINLFGSTGRAGDISIQVAGLLSVKGNIDTSTANAAAGGAIDLRAGSIVLDKVARVSSISRTSGTGGAVTLNANDVTITGGAAIFSPVRGSGKGGLLSITAKLLAISNPNTGIVLNCEAACSGQAGDINIDVTDLRMTQTSRLVSNTFGSGNAGSVTIKADTMFLQRDSRISSEGGADAQGAASGNAGQLRIDTRLLTLDDGGKISTSAFGSGGAGTLVVNASEIRMSGTSAALGNSGITSGTFGKQPGGSVTINTGLLQMVGNSTISTQSVADSTGAGGDAGSVVINATDVLLQSGGRITSAGLDGNGAAGLIQVTANTLTLADGGQIQTIINKGGTGGSIRLLVGDVVNDGSTITSEAQQGSTGPAGSVEIRGTSLAVRNGGVISTTASGTGAGGSITVTDQDIRVSSGGQITARAEARSTGAAGRVQLAGNVDVRDANSLVTSSTRGRGDAGGVQVSGGTLTVADSGAITADAETGSAGNAGQVTVDSSAVAIQSAGRISSSTFSSGAAGLVRIAADTVSNTGGTIASAAQSGSTGRAGNVEVAARQMTIGGAGSVSSQTLGAGAAGSVKITAPDLRITDAGQVTSRAAPGATGAAGAVEIVSTTLQIDNGATVTSSTAGPKDAGGVSLRGTDITVGSNALVSAQAEAGSTGNAGQVSVQAAGTLLVTGGAQISSATAGKGAAGGVTANARVVRVEQGGAINSLAAPGSTGSAGGVTVTASDALELHSGGVITSDTFGPGDAGGVTITAANITGDGNSRISSNSDRCDDGSCVASGKAGAIQVNAGQALKLAGGGTIATTTKTAGAGGSVTVQAKDVTVGSGAGIRAEALASGSAGDVTIGATTLNVTADGTVSTSTFGSGDAGQVLVGVKSLALTGGEVSSSAGSGGGRSGNIGITTDTATLTQGGQLQTSSASAAPAGSILLKTTALEVRGAGSQIASENSYAGGQAGQAFRSAAASAAGAAGSIDIIGANSIILADGGRITTNSVSGPAGAITIQTPRSAIIRLEGADQPGVITTSSGPGTGGRITIAQPFAIISDGGNILALGQLGGANVQIQSDFFIRSADRVNLLSVAGSLVLDSVVQDVSSGTTVRELNIIDASKVLRGQCASVRRSRDTSQLAIQALGPFTLGSDRSAEPVGSGGGCS